MCYLFILFHELSHIFVASLFGKKMEKLKLTLSGVNVKFEREKYILKSENEYFHNMLIYFAGPLSNIILAMIFHSNIMIYEINICLGMINLLPIYPLDGYNILKNVLGNNYKNIYLDIIGNITLIVLFLISIYQILFLKSISILIFSVYIFLIKMFAKYASK
ncbi:MAG: hypothetical protein Q4D02_01065 [Clostridia bacterium]|nr:hypothetical protein [Clostridia bacterium]